MIPSSCASRVQRLRLDLPPGGAGTPFHRLLRVVLYWGLGHSVAFPALRASCLCPSAPVARAACGEMNEGGAGRATGRGAWGVGAVGAGGGGRRSPSFSGCDSSLVNLLSTLLIAYFELRTLSAPPSPPSRSGRTSPPYRPAEKKSSINTERAFSMPALPACVAQHPAEAPLRPLDPELCSSPSTRHIPSIRGEIFRRFSWSTSSFHFTRKDAALVQHGANLQGGPQSRFFLASSRPHPPFPHLRRPLAAPRALSSTATIASLHDVALTWWLLSMLLPACAHPTSSDQTTLHAPQSIHSLRTCQFFPPESSPDSFPPRRTKEHALTPVRVHFGSHGFLPAPACALPEHICSSLPL